MQRLFMINKKSAYNMVSKKILPQGFQLSTLTSYKSKYKYMLHLIHQSIRPSIISNMHTRMYTHRCG